jgi:hypothetical protein
MQREVISTCPVCESQLHVTRLHCNTCGTTIEGEFNVGRFANLGRDQMLLLEAFLRSRGNLRELERELSVSYPTVRNRVEALLRALGLTDGSPLPSTPVAGSDGEGRPTAGPGVDAAARRQVLERLARKEITADEAAALLRGEQPASAKASDKNPETDLDPEEDTTIVQLEDA